MSHSPMPRVLDALRFDSQAQWSTLLSFLALLVPLSLLIVGDDGGGLVIAVCGVLLVIGLAWFVLRLGRMRRSFADGERLDGRVIELRPSLADRRTIIFEYTAAGRPQRGKYHLSTRLLPSLRPGSNLRLIVDPGRPSRAYLRDLYE